MDTVGCQYLGGVFLGTARLLGEYRQNFYKATSCSRYEHASYPTSKEEASFFAGIRRVCEWGQETTANRLGLGVDLPSLEVCICDSIPEMIYGFYFQNEYARDYYRINGEYPSAPQEEARCRGFGAAVRWAKGRVRKRKEGASLADLETEDLELIHKDSEHPYCPTKESD